MEIDPPSLSLPSIPRPRAKSSLRARLADRRLRRPLAAVVLVVLAIAPVVHVLSHAMEARRDIVYWDEFDTALALMLKLKQGTSTPQFLQELVSVNNEHRMVVSRAIFAGSYWLTGTINFATLNLVGNGAVVLLCGLLVATARTGTRRLKMAALLGLILFQLESFENFLWSGSSIDHFPVVLFAAAALVALQRRTVPGTLVAGVCGTIATFTLAQGLAVWPAGGLLLAATRRRRDLALWGGFAGLAVTLFFVGFKLNGAEKFADLSAAGLAKILHYWLSILGSAPALGDSRLAPYFGAGSLLLLAYAAVHRGLRREPIAFSITIFCLLGAGLIAIGRAEHAGGIVHSRYYILGTLVWALALFMLVERHTHPRRPFQALAMLLPTLIAFNLLANREFSDEADSWMTCRDIAAVSYRLHGVDGRGPFNLHPNPARSTALLRAAETAGVYRLGSICGNVPFPATAHESGRIQYYVETIVANDASVSVQGWAGIPGQTSRRGSVQLVLRSADGTRAFTTVGVPRADVPPATKQPGWLYSGFQFARRTSLMPAGVFRIGLLITNGRESEYIMTGHHVTIGATAGPARVTGQ